MSFLDKIFGRSKKAAGDLTGDDSMKREGMHQEAESTATERAEDAEGVAQEERNRAAEHHAAALAMRLAKGARSHEILNALLNLGAIVGGVIIREIIPQLPSNRCPLNPSAPLAKRPGRG